MKKILNKTFDRKSSQNYKSCNLLSFLLILCFFIPNIIKAQPGWQDLTARYYYTILDGKDQKISFKKNKNYSVIIDSVLYKAPNIPTDTLKPAIENESYNFDNYIRINDLSLRIPQNIHNRYHPLEIKIVQKKDTMYLNQTTGIGSTVLHWEEINGIRSGRYIEKISEQTLQFIPGYYYLPYWAKSLNEELPLTSGKVKIVNLNQRHFLIPKTLYHSIASSDTKYRSKDKLKEKADEWVLNNFTKGYFAVDKKIEPTKFDTSLFPYIVRGWGEKIYPTKDKNIYLGLITYDRDTLNYSESRGVFSIFNKKENTVKHWLPTENARLSATTNLYYDNFNNIFYNASIVWDSNCKSLSKYSDCLFEKKYFRSEDEGKNWAEDQTLQKLFGKYEFRKLEFLDKNHALGFTLRTIKHTKKKYDLQQGTYYLLKNMQIIDSLKTPVDVHYNSNEIGYRFAMKTDTIFLGAWRFDEYATYGKPYFQPMIIKNNDNWSFQVKQETYVRPEPEIEKNTIIEYQNFKLLNKREMVFKNGSGTLKLKSNIVETPKENGIYVIEKGSEIYLLGTTKCSTYISFDGGTSWYIYPSVDLRFYANELLEIDDQSVISFFNNRELYEGFYKFSLKK